MESMPFDEIKVEPAWEDFDYFGQEEDAVPFDPLSPAVTGHAEYQEEDSKGEDSDPVHFGLQRRSSSRSGKSAKRTSASLLATDNVRRNPPRESSNKRKAAKRKSIGNKSTFNVKKNKPSTSQLIEQKSSKDQIKGEREESSDSIAAKSSQVHKLSDDRRTKSKTKKRSKRGSLGTRVPVRKKPVEVRGSYPCNECGKIFSLTRNLGRHVKEVHTVSPQKCDMCNNGKIFRNKTLLAIHKRRMHPKNRRGEAMLDKRREMARVYKARKRQKDAELRLQKEVVEEDERATVAEAGVGSCNPFSCDICNKGFRTNKILLGHKKYMHASEPVKCLSCSRVFRNGEQLRKHVQRLHTSSTADREAYLAKERERKKFKRLNPTVDTSRVYNCSVCNAEFNLKIDLQSHERFVHNTKVNCPVCNKEYAHNESLRCHMNKAHSTKVRMNIPVKCEICKEMLANKATLKVHMKYMHSSFKDPSSDLTFKNGVTSDGESLTIVVCQECKAEFRKPAELKRHLKTHIPDDGTRHQCDQCPSKYRWPEGLKMHMKRVHETTEQAVCDECGKSFRNQIYLKFHRRWHVRGWPFQCQFCPRIFKIRGAQRYHEKRDHGGAGTFKCTKCEGLEFKSSVFLEKHTRFFHPELLKNPPAKKPQRKIAVPTLLLDDTIFSESADNDKDPVDATNLISVEKGEKKLVDQKSKNKNVFSLNAFDTRIEKPNPIGSSTNTSNHTETEQYPEEEADGAGGQGDDDWFGFDDGELPSADTPLQCEVKPDVIHQTQYQYRPKRTEIDSRLRVKVEQGDDDAVNQHSSLQSGTCPKLALKTVVKLKRFTPAYHRKGNVYCELCLLNFNYPKYLATHMQLIHGISYVPKPWSKSKTPRHSLVVRKRRHREVSSSSSSGSEEKESKYVDDEQKGSHATSETVDEADVGNGSNPKKKKKFHICKFCDEVCPSHKSLQNHIELIHVNVSHKCPSCPSVFQLYCNLQRHVRKLHSGGQPLTCDQCPKQFQHKAGLRTHLRQVHRNMNLTCPICNKTNLKSMQSLRHHNKTVHAEGPGKFMCDKCPFSAHIAAQLRQHMHSHPVPGVTFQCEECGRSCKNQVTLNAHKEQHVQEFNYRCLYCSKKFNSVRTKRVHENEFHNNPSGHTCRVCKKVCQSCPILEKHVRIDHSEEELEQFYYEPAKLVPESTYTSVRKKLSEEEMLQKMRDSQIELITPKRRRGKRHNLTELRSKVPRFCPHCNLLCQNQRAERQHIAETHPLHAYRRCEECNLPFFTTMLFRIHNADVHGATPHPCACPKCGIVLLRPESLRSHIYSHDGPVPCDICGKESKSQVALRRHKREVHVKVRSKEFRIAVDELQQQEVTNPLQQE